MQVHLTRSTFGERLGFACWLYYLEHARAPSDAAIGKAAGRTGAAVAAWFSLEEPPPDYKIQKPLAAFFGVTVAWLFDNEVPAPNLVLWEVWLKARRSKRLGRAQQSLDTLEKSLRPARRIAKPAEQDDRKDGRHGRA